MWFILPGTVQQNTTVHSALSISLIAVIVKYFKDSMHEIPRRDEKKTHSSYIFESDSSFNEVVHNSGPSIITNT